MSSRPQFQPQTVITNGNLATTLTSAVTIVQKLSLITYTYSWSGTSPVAAVSVQISNDYSQNGTGAVLNAGTWNTLPLSETPSISGNTGNGAIDVQLPGSYAIRTVITPGSGSGTVTAVINAKVS